MFKTVTVLCNLHFLLTHRITEMQQQKENLTAQVNETVAKQLALQEEAAALKLVVGNITSSLHQLALTDASPSPETPLNQTHPTNRTAEVSLDGTCRAQMEIRGIIMSHYRPMSESFGLIRAALTAARVI